MTADRPGLANPYNEGAVAVVTGPGGRRPGSRGGSRCLALGVLTAGLTAGAAGVAGADPADEEEFDPAGAVVMAFDASTDLQPPLDISEPVPTVPASRLDIEALPPVERDDTEADTEGGPDGAAPVTDTGPTSLSGALAGGPLTVTDAGTTATPEAAVAERPVGDSAVAPSGARLAVDPTVEIEPLTAAAGPVDHETLPGGRGVQEVRLVGATRDSEPGLLTRTPTGDGTTDWVMVVQARNPDGTVSGFAPPGSSYDATQPVQFFRAPSDEPLVHVTGSGPVASGRQAPGHNRPGGEVDDATAPVDPGATPEPIRPPDQTDPAASDGSDLSSYGAIYTLTGAAFDLPLFLAKLDAEDVVAGRPRDWRRNVFRAAPAMPFSMARAYVRTGTSITPFGTDAPGQGAVDANEYGNALANAVASSALAIGTQEATRVVDPVLNAVIAAAGRRTAGASAPPAITTRSPLAHRTYIGMNLLYQGLTTTADDLIEMAGQEDNEALDRVVDGLVAGVSAGVPIWLEIGGRPTPALFVLPALQALAAGAVTDPPEDLGPIGDALLETCADENWIRNVAEQLVCGGVPSGPPRGPFGGYDGVPVAIRPAPAFGYAVSPDLDRVVEPRPASTPRAATVPEPAPPSPGATRTGPDGANAAHRTAPRPPVGTRPASTHAGSVARAPSGRPVEVSAPTVQSQDRAVTGPRTEPRSVPAPVTTSRPQQDRPLPQQVPEPVGRRPAPAENPFRPVEQGARWIEDNVLRPAQPVAEQVVRAGAAAAAAAVAAGKFLWELGDAVPGL